MQGNFENKLYFFSIVLQQEVPNMELLLSKGLGTIASGHQLMVKGPWPWKQWCMTAMQLKDLAGIRCLKVAKKH